MTQPNTTKKVVKPYGLDEDQPASNKWIAVAGLLLVTSVLLGLFLRFVFAPDKPKVHLATVLIADYAERLLPKPAFVNWQIDWEKAKHFQPWSGSLESRQITIKTAKEFFRVPTEIQTLLSNGRKETKDDTLIVYLRGLSLVQRNTENSAEDQSTGDSSELVLLASEYDPEYDPDDKPKAYVPIAQMLGDLKKLPLKHIVVLADIHDLLVAQKLGYPRNDVGQALKAAVGSLQRNDGAELWVVAAADSGQPSHISYLQKKTLLQSAVEYSLRENKPEKSQPLALTDFFQKVFDYSRAASENYQTPLLLLNGSSQPVRKESDDWKLASKVSIVQPPDKSLTADKNRNGIDTDQEANNEDSTAASSKPKSTDDDSKSATDGQVTGGTPSVTGVETRTAEEEPVEKDIRLRFWQLRDQIARDAKKDPNRPPTPSSFAADRWQHLIREATAYERLCWALDAESEKRKEYEQKIADLVKELNDFHAISLANNSLETSTSGDSLSDRWSQMRNQLDNRFSERRVWLDHGLLDKDLQAMWKMERVSLLTLADFACQLPYWFELSHELQQEMPKIFSDSQPLFEEVRDNARLWAEKGFVLSTRPNGPPSIDLGKLQNKLQSQKDELDQCVEKLVEKLNAKKLNWRDERKVQVLLSSGLLDWKQRKELSKYFGLSESNMEPIRPSDPSAPQGQSIGSATFTFLDDFFQQLHQQSESTPKEQYPWKAWLLSCIDHLRPKHAADQPSDAKRQDLLLPGSDDQTLQVLNFPTTQRVSRPIEFEIRRRNGTSLKQCWICWRTESNDNIAADNVAALKIDSSGTSLPIQTAKQIVSESNQDRFKLSTKLTSQTELLRTDTRLVFEFSDAQPQASTSGPSNKKPVTARSVVQRNLTLQPQPTEEFELIIDRWGPVAGQAEQKKQRMIDPNTISSDVEPALEVPAVGQAKAQYQFSLRNREERERRVQVKLYPVIAPSQQDWIGGTGRVSEFNQKYTRNQLKELKHIAEIKEVQLPDASKDNSKPVLLEFPVNANDAASPSKQPAASYGLLLLVEELKKPASAGDQPPTDPPPVWHLSGERQFFWLDCKFNNPFESKFVELEPRLLDDQSLEITVSVPGPTWWTYWGIPKLGIKGRMTDENGNSLSSGSANKVTLDQKNPQMNMTFKLSTKEMQKRPEKMVVHLDIGEYPRAIAYEWSKGSNQPQSANRSFFWLGQPNISRSSMDTNGQPPPTPPKLIPDIRNQQLSEPGRWIIPYRENVNEKSVGNDLPNGLLTIPFQVDFPKNNQSSACTIEFQQEQLEYETDRRFEPAFEILDGRLQMSAKAMDHRWSKDISEISGDGEFPIHFSMADQEPKKMLTIVRDTQPPEDESSVRINPRDLYSDASLTIELAPKDKDDLSPIHHVYFAINRPFQDESPVYDDDDIGFEPPKEAQRNADGAFRLELTAADLEKAIEKSLGRPTIGTGYDIVARSVDAAGNIQDKHRSARFIWKGPKPVAKTKKEKAKPELPPPAPEVPKLFTITVVVKQEGKTPAYPENIDVNGPGDRRSPVENRIVFTDVPAGIAEYKAVYTPPIGNVFEAQKSINVTKNQTIELDTKLKK